MIDDNRRASQEQERARVRRRTNVTVDKDNYQYFPEKKQIDYYDNDVHQNVAVYARVSTGNVQQTTSYELQKKYYAEAPTVKLAFYMYLYGYSSQQIADAFMALGRRTYLGNLKWTANSIVQVLRNERHCGDVLTRKTFTYDSREHLSRKNMGERPQSLYYNHHPAIVSRDDFIAVQKMLYNAKYGNKGFLPQLKVIDSGIFRGYVGINPRWASFKEADYLQASLSVYTEEELSAEPTTAEVEVAAGDFDLRGFEITRSEFLDSTHRPAVSFGDKRMSFSIACTRKFREKNYVELLINPAERKFAVRPTNKDNRSGVQFSIHNHGTYSPRGIPATAFLDTIYSLFGWNAECKYRIIGSLYEQDGELAYIFDADNAEIYLSSGVMSPCDESGSLLKPIMSSGKRIRAIPQEWVNSFGKDYYLHELSIAALESQSEEDWKLRLEGRCFEIGKRLNVTPFADLRAFIKQELKDIDIQEVAHAGTTA